MPLDSPSPLQRNKQHPAKQMSGPSAAPLRPSKPSPPPPHALRRLFLGLTTPVAALALFLLAAAAAVFLYSQSQTGAAARPYGSLEASDALLNPMVQIVNFVDVIWSFPAATMPRALLFVAHGCSCRPENFWPRSERCPMCVGLPEDVAITAGALERGFAVLGVASAGDCWSLGSEVLAVKSVIQSWGVQNGMSDLPVVALGASSGGYFVSRLASKMRLAAVVIMIAEGTFGRPAASLPTTYPPTMFFHMPKDKRTAELVGKNSKMLRKNGVEVKELQSLEFPLTPTLLSERIPGLDSGLSQRIWDAFKEEGFVDEKGYLRKDGRSTPWKDALVKRGFWKEAAPWAGHIQEELNLAYAFHEMTSLHINEMFDWIDKHLR